MMKRILPILLILLLCACGTPEPIEEAETPEPTVGTEEIVIEKDGLSDPAILVTAIPTPEPTPEPTDTPEPTPTPDGLLGGRFPDKFSDTPILEDRSYKSKSIGIEIKRYDTDGVYGKQVVYFVADIYVQDVTSIKTEAAQKDFTKNYTRLVADIARDAGALLAVDGDTYGRTNRGFIVRNGIVYRKRLIEDKDICVLYRDGRMETFRRGKYKIDDVIAADPWQVWNFGPELLDKDGKAYPEYPGEVTRMRYEGPRCALGYYEPGHYCFVIVDGRQPGYSDGIKLVDLSRLMEDLGCTVAYNMDGGGSAIMYWNGEVISKGSNGTRTISDIIYLLPEE